MTPEIHARPAAAREAPADYEARALDWTIEALEDLAECDEARIYIKWDRLFPHPKPGGDGVSQARSDVAGVLAPVLYILFRPSAIARVESLPRVHTDPEGRLCAAHAVCLASMPSGALLEGQRLKDTVRRGVEQFLRMHNLSPTPLVNPFSAAPPPKVKAHA